MNNNKTIYSVIFMVSAAHFLNDTMQSVIPAVYPIIKQNFSLTFTEIGIITLTFQIASSMLQPFIGFYTDKKPLPFSLAAGMCFTITGLIAIAFSEHFYSFLISVSLIGFGSSVFHPESSKVALMFAGNRKSLAQSIFQVGGNTGSAMGPILAALIVIPFGQKSISWFAVCALITIIILIKIGIKYKERLDLEIKKEIDNKTPPLKKNKIKRNIKFILLILVILILSKNIYSSCMTNFFTFFLIDKFGISVQYSQICLFVFLAASAIGTVLGGYFADRFKKKYVILGSIFGAAPFTLALPYTDIYLTIILSAVIGIIISSAFSIILVYAVEMMPEKTGTISGVFFGLSFGIGGIASAMFGRLSDIISINTAFQIISILPLIGIAAIWLPDKN